MSALINTCYSKDVKAQVDLRYYFKEQRTWTWSDINWAPCDGVGINASASFEVTATFVGPRSGDCQHQHGDQLITAPCAVVDNLIVNVKTGVNNVQASGFISNLDNGKERKRIQLESPSCDAIGRPGVLTLWVVPDKELNKSIGRPPCDTQFTCGYGAKCESLIVKITLIAKLNGGTCVLGTTSHTLEF